VRQVAVPEVLPSVLPLGGKRNGCGAWHGIGAGASMDISGEKAHRRGDAATYVEQVASELRDLAVRNDLDFLAYSLDMTRQAAAMESAKSRRQAPVATAK